MAPLVRCFACGGLFPAGDGPTHRYMESSPGCWAAYGEVLAREYSDRAHGRLHRLTVDAYAVQHPGGTSPQAVQSAAVHLVSLYLVLELGKPLEEATRAIGVIPSRKGRYTWLDPPQSMSPITVADVHGAQDGEGHLAWVRKWADSAWQAWRPHHDTVRAWANELTEAIEVKGHGKFLSRS
jgi:Family of unknown function (DUF5946)